MNLSHRLPSRLKTMTKLHVPSLDAKRSSSVSAVSSFIMPPCSRPLRRAVIYIVAISISIFVLYRSLDSLDAVPSSSSIFSRIFPSFDSFQSLELEEPKLEDVLRRAATRDNTVILTTLNEAWAAPGSVIDLFFESF
ncbi:hypothetical protein DY000_02025008 [Brassica cretica]|uniref:Nucleotide-diphospho-sugar transferase domain-containing protein n=1 Tax=Brassica cretica TaxID=69181 RepID=A0ABQ7E644_BRACR|nr:hypothetical protein DY000_02025008 [Brassica cretica]